MSAICGAVGLDGRPFDTLDLDGMLHTLSRLGPDGEGTWAGRAGALGVAVGMHLRRRVPEDLFESPPVTSADGRLVLVADVVLNNRSDLAGRLGVPDRPDVPDSRILLAAYERWGRACPEQLLGEFAFAVVDQRQGGVFLARDQLGMRPLQVHQRPGVLAFASTALALTDFEGVGHELDTLRFTEHLALIMNTERSWVAGVRPLAPATALWVDNTGTQTRRYWTLDTNRRADLSPEQHAEALRATLDEAVACRLRRTGGIGISLSGGLDSTSVAASAATALGSEPLHGYTSVPPPGWQGERIGKWEPDERHLVKELASGYPNLQPTFVDVRGTSFLDGHTELFEAGAPPPRNPCNMMWLGSIYAAAARDGVSTLLNGASGNMFFSADDPYWLAALLRRGRLPTLLREARSWAGGTDTNLRSVLASALLSEFTPALVSHWRRRRAGRADPLSEWLSATALRPARQHDIDILGAMPWLDRRRRSAPRDQGLFVLGGRAGQAEQVAAYEARSGLRIADPTADVRILELCAAQPAWVRRRDGMARAVCRSAMAGRLPDSIRLRTERGAQLPDWLDRLTEVRAQVTAEVSATAEHPVTRRVIDVELLEEALRAWPQPTLAPSAEVNRQYRLVLMRALTTSRYVRWFGERAQQRPVPARR